MSTRVVPKKQFLPGHGGRAEEWRPEGNASAMWLDWGRRLAGLHLIPQASPLNSTITIRQMSGSVSQFVTWLPFPWSPWIGRSFCLEPHKEAGRSAWPERPPSSDVECDIGDWGCLSFARTSDTDSSQVSQMPVEMKENFLWSLIKNRAGNSYRPDLLICLCMCIQYVQENLKWKGMGHS